MTKMRLTMEDCREAGMCVRGVVRFCKQSGFDAVAFIKDGVDIDDIEHLDDGRVQTMIRRVREKHGR